uniref:Nuclear condensin complex subunit 3 C-terminal domain-containing protein n=1 Tax=Panagrolaimus sp. PS1159 TaxID=55785 RepID=A0AC35EV43_9BILA
MAPSPAKNKSRMSRNTAEIAREICAAIKDVYYDSSKDSFKKRTTDLLNLYKQERDVIINKDEYMSELGYRVDVFLDGAKCHEGQLRVFKLYALLAVKCLKDFDDSSILETVMLSIHKKKYNISAFIRNSVVALIGRLLYCAVLEPKKGDNKETFYATVLPERTFIDLYTILWHLSADTDEDIRVGVLIAIARVQSYPGLMKLVNTDIMETTKQLFVLGTRDLSEKVRCQAVKGITVETAGESRLLLERLIHDPCEEVRLEIAKKLSTDVPITFFSKAERQSLIRARDLFLADTIIPEYYEILYSWACDLYCERQGYEFDVQLTQSQILSGVYDLLDSFRITKELGQIFQRFFDHLRTKFFEDIADDEKSFVLFAQLFEYKDSPYLNAENYEDVAAVDDVSTGLNALNDKMKALFMWQYLTEYSCHLRLSEATRDECRKILLPTMSEFSKFIPEIWTTLKAGGEKESERRVYEYQNNCAKSLINMFHSIDTEELGMIKWKETLSDLLVDYSFKYDSDLVSLIVHDYFYYHYDIKHDPDNALHELSDLMTKIGDVGAKFNNTQDMYVETTQMDFTQLMNASQSNEASPSPMENMEPQKRKRCVQVLAGVFKNGFFLQHHPVLEGLLTDYAIATFDNPIDHDSRREAFICIAGMAPLLDQNNANFVKYARTILEDQRSQIVELQKIALLLIHDSIGIYGYAKVNEWYFAEVENATTSSNKLVKKLIDLCETPDTAFSSFVIRILLRFILFDHQRTFHDAFVYLLLKLFNPGEEKQLKILLVYFFTQFCHYSREHQCIMAAAFVDAMMKLADIDLDSPFINVDRDEMITFVLQITSFNVLNAKALDREHGTAHLYLAARLLTKLEKVLDNKNYAVFFGGMLNKCEVSEVFEEKLFETVKRGCERLHPMTPDARVKKFIETFHKRLESAEKHSKSKKAIARPEIIPKSRQELEKEMEEIVYFLKSNTEETNINKRTWLTEEIPKEEGIFSKMRIFGEVHITIDDIRAKLIEKDSPLFQSRSENPTERPPRPTTTPRKREREVVATPSTPKNRSRNNLPPPSTRTLRRKPLKERLNTVAEEEDFAD